MATPPGPGNSGLFHNYSYPSQVMGNRYDPKTGRGSPPILRPGGITHAGNAPIAPIRPSKTTRYAPYQTPPIMRRQMVGGFLGDASINPLTGGDTGQSDPLPPSDTFNWASLLTTVAQTGTAVNNALHPATVPHAPAPLAAGPSPVLVAAGVGILGLAAYLAFSKPRR